MTNRDVAVSVAAVYFDLGDTLGSPTVAGRPPRLNAFDVFPFVPDLLRAGADRRA